jgi:transposase-like protein
MAEGVSLLEVRLVDIARRYNVVNREVLNKWNAFFEIKSYFDEKCGMNIYSLFYDEIIKNCIR